MKSVLVVLLIVASSVVRAGFVEEYALARGLVKDKKWVEAQAAFESLLVSYPDEAVNNKASVEFYVGRCLTGQLKHEEAAQAYERVLTLYPEAAGETRALAQCALGKAFFNQKRFSEAEQHLRKVVTDYSSAMKTTLASVYRNLTILYTRQGETAKASLAAIDASTKCGFISLEWHLQRHAEVDAVAVGTEAYREYLSNLLLVIPATEEHAEFLGEVKSQLELIK